jgi:predicted O-methyltransferase YrrM
MNPTDKFKTPLDLRESVSAFQRSRIILSAYELELFTVIGKERKSPEQVATEAKTDKHATERLMNALCAIGLLEKKDGLYNNSEFGLNYLVKDRPGFIAGLMHSSNLWRSWSNLTEIVRTGRENAQTIRTKSKDGDWSESFIAAMHDRAYRQAPAIVAQIDLNGIRKVLDIGGGSGAYSMAFVRAGKEINATVFDLPNIVTITEKYIRAEGLQNKIDTLAGDYLVDSFRAGYDLAFLSAIIHINSFDENLRLVKKCAAALNRGGIIAIQDHVMGQDRTNPAPGAIFAINMLVGTQKGDTYTENEIRWWMAEAGFDDVQRKETFQNALIIGRKK